MLHGRLHYAWVVAGVVFVLLLCSAGVRSTPGVLIIPLEKSLGCDRTTISSAVALNLFLFGLMGPFAGAAMLRFGDHAQDVVHHAYVECRCRFVEQHDVRVTSKTQRDEHALLLPT